MRSRLVYPSVLSLCGWSGVYGREIVKRFVAAGHHVDVLTSDARDLRYFTDRRSLRVDAR